MSQLAEAAFTLASQTLMVEAQRRRCAPAPTPEDFGWDPSEPGSDDCSIYIPALFRAQNALSRRGILNGVWLRQEQQHAEAVRQSALDTAKALYTPAFFTLSFLLLEESVGIDEQLERYR